MPNLRVITWNSGGEADGRGATLTAFANAVNAAYYNPAVAGSVPVQVVVTQESSVGGGGSIAAALAIAPFNQFATGHYREHVPPGAGQPHRVGMSKAYRLGWMNAHPTVALNLVPAGGAPAHHLINLDPAHDAGVAAWINGLPLSPGIRTMVRDAAANMRWPVYQAFAYAGTSVHVITWHVELRANWLGANVHGPMVAQGLPEAFLFLQNSTFYLNLIATLGANDLIVIAGDLNATGAEMGNALFFNAYAGVFDNLTHILAFSPNGAMNFLEHQAHVTPYPPHCIVTARVSW
ncbi:MAG TPA: hypothetical protein VFR81_20355 [Longimicrobium sp.]|nr:hypothetical protein [Longimicrobium sp.]